MNILNILYLLVNKNILFLYFFFFLQEREFSDRYYSKFSKDLAKIYFHFKNYSEQEKPISFKCNTEVLFTTVANLQLRKNHIILLYLNYFHYSSLIFFIKNFQTLK